jgi:hypothetical protein
MTCLLFLCSVALVCCSDEDDDASIDVDFSDDEVN